MNREKVCKLAALAKAAAENKTAFDWNGIQNNVQSAIGSGMDGIKSWAASNPRLAATLASGGIGAGLGYGSHLLMRGLRGPRADDTDSALDNVFMGGLAGAGLANADVAMPVMKRINDEFVMPWTRKLHNNFGVNTVETLPAARIPGFIR